MFENALKWLEGKWWGIVVAYILLLAGTYGTIWGIVDPLEIQEKFSSLPGCFYRRWFYHIIATLLFASYLLLGLMLHLRHRATKRQEVRLPLFDCLYDVSKAKEFYNTIAHQYDQRNSTELLNTHRTIVQLIDKYALPTGKTEILDLGGGTGKVIAEHFFSRSDIYWEYVDSSSSMADEFRNNFKGTNLNVQVELNDIHSYVNRKPDRLFDIILLSFVLSSMDCDPDWQMILNLLKPNGQLIIADADASYVSLHPYYAVQCGKEIHALRPRYVSLSRIIADSKRVGFNLEDALTVNEGAINYSFVALFKKRG